MEGKELRGQMGTKHKGMGRDLKVSRAGPGPGGEGCTGLSPGTMGRSRAAKLLRRAPTGGSALHFMLHSLNEHWQGLKWEKVEAAEVAAVETSIFTLAGRRQVSGGFE